MRVLSKIDSVVVCDDLKIIFLDELTKIKIIMDWLILFYERLILMFAGDMKFSAGFLNELMPLVS